jgi:hypothetical protein
MQDFIEEACKVENGFFISTSGPDIKMETLLKQWASILLDIPAWLREMPDLGLPNCTTIGKASKREISWRRWVGAAEAQSVNQEKVSRIPLPRRGSARIVQRGDTNFRAGQAARRQGEEKQTTRHQSHQTARHTVFGRPTENDGKLVLNSSSKSSQTSQGGRNRPTTNTRY